MINDKVLEKLSERLTERMAKVNTRVLTIIGKQIKHIGTLNYSTANNLVNMLKYGADFDKIIQEISKATDLNTKEIYKIFEEVAREDLRFARQFYDYKNKPYIPYEENLMLQREVKVLAEATADKFLNIANTTAFRINGKDVPLAEAYQKIIDESILAVSQGQETYTQAMRKTIKELGTSGIRTRATTGTKVIDYESGYSRRLDSTVRMVVMDGIGALHNKAQELLAEELGLDGVEITVHDNPAPDHEDIQGRQYSKEEYKDLNESLKRPISTMNCYHYIYTIQLGISKPNYTEEQLQEIKDNNKKGFEYEGKHYTMYEGTQLQRRIETEVRRQKDIHTMAKASGDKEQNELIVESQIKIRQLNKKYKELSEISGLPTKMDRLKVEGFKRVNLKELK